MELNISNIDIVVILLFVVGIIWWALKNRKNENASEYFLAGKSQNWFVVGSSLFAASVSSSTLMGHSGEGFISGIAVFNYNVGAIFVIIFVSLFFLPFYIKSGIYTIPEYLGRRLIIVRGSIFRSSLLSAMCFWMPELLCIQGL